MKNFLHQKSKITTMKTKKKKIFIDKNI